MSYKQKIR